MTEFEVAILDALTRIEGKIDRLERPSRCRQVTSDDWDLLAVLLPAIAGRYGSANFTVAELFSDSVFPALIGSRSPACVGKAFSRAAGKPIGEFKIEALGAANAGKTLWRLLRVG